MISGVWLLAVIVGVGADTAPCPFTECAKKTEQQITVLSVDQPDGSAGMYFHFDRSQVDERVGTTSWNATRFLVRQIRNGQRKDERVAILWRHPHGGSVGNGHGRWDDGTASPGQWAVGDSVEIPWHSACSSHKDEGACKAETQQPCAYDQTAGCSQGTCRAITNLQTCDNIQTCRSDGSACKYDRCKLQSDELKCNAAFDCSWVNGGCQHYCMKWSTDVLCAADNACEWDSTTTKCQGLCSKQADETACQGVVSASKKYCQWSTGSAFCARYCITHDQTQCNNDNRCTWDTQSNECRLSKCEKHSVEADCKADITCNWDTTNTLCQDKVAWPGGKWEGTLTNTKDSSKTTRVRIELPATACPNAPLCGKISWLDSNCETELFLPTWTTSLQGTFTALEMPGTGTCVVRPPRHISMVVSPTGNVVLATVLYGEEEKGPLAKAGGATCDTFKNEADCKFSECNWLGNKCDKSCASYTTQPTCTTTYCSWSGSACGNKPMSWPGPGKWSEELALPSSGDKVLIFLELPDDRVKCNNIACGKVVYSGGGYGGCETQLSNTATLFDPTIGIAELQERGFQPPCQQQPGILKVSQKLFHQQNNQVKIERSATASSPVLVGGVLSRFTPISYPQGAMTGQVSNTNSGTTNTANIHIKLSQFCDPATSCASIGTIEWTNQPGCTTDLTYASTTPPADAWNDIIGILKAKQGSFSGTTATCNPTDGFVTLTVAGSSVKFEWSPKQDASAPQADLWKGDLTVVNEPPSELECFSTYCDATQECIPWIVDSPSVCRTSCPGFPSRNLTRIDGRLIATCVKHSNDVCDPNGWLQPGEGCDDGNTMDGDGCDQYCQLESDNEGGLCVECKSTHMYDRSSGGWMQNTSFDQPVACESKLVNSTQVEVSITLNFIPNGETEISTSPLPTPSHTRSLDPFSLSHHSPCLHPTPTVLPSDEWMFSINPENPCQVIWQTTINILDSDVNSDCVRVYDDVDYTLTVTCTYWVRRYFILGDDDNQKQPSVSEYMTSTTLTLDPSVVGIVGVDTGVGMLSTSISDTCLLTGVFRLFHDTTYSIVSEDYGISTVGGDDVSFTVTNIDNTDQVVRFTANTAEPHIDTLAVLRLTLQHDDGITTTLSMANYRLHVKGKCTKWLHESSLEAPTLRLFSDGHQDSPAGGILGTADRLTVFIPYYSRNSVVKLLKHKLQVHLVNEANQHKTELIADGQFVVSHQQLANPRWTLAEELPDDVEVGFSMQLPVSSGRYLMVVSLTYQFVVEEENNKMHILDVDAQYGQQRERSVLSSIIIIVEQYPVTNDEFSTTTVVNQGNTLQQAQSTSGSVLNVVIGGLASVCIASVVIGLVVILYNRSKKKKEGTLQVESRDELGLQL